MRAETLEHRQIQWTEAGWMDGYMAMGQVACSKVLSKAGLLLSVGLFQFYLSSFVFFLSWEICNVQR